MPFFFFFFFFFSWLLLWLIYWVDNPTTSIHTLISSNCNVIITFPWLRRGHFHVWRGEIMSTTCFSWLEALTVEEHHLYHWFNLVYQYHIWLNADSFIKSMAHERFKDPICWLPLRKALLQRQIITATIRHGKCGKS
jgi:hypothetical protein